MKRIIMLFSILLLVVGCGTTAQPGIGYGMTKQAVIARISRTDKVISTDGDTVVTEGLFDPSKQLARKTFTFQDGKLFSVTYVIIGSGGIGTNTTMTFMK